MKDDLNDLVKTKAYLNYFEFCDEYFRDKLSKLDDKGGYQIVFR